MNRRQGVTARPASSEEIDCWSHATTSLSALSGIYSSPATLDTIGRVNRLISAWPTDDTLPAEGLDEVKKNYKRLCSGLEQIQTSSNQEIKAIEDALEHLGVLIALRKAPEVVSTDKRINKRPRAPSPSGTPVPTSQPPARGVSITLPPRASVGPSPPVPFSREPKARREALAKQLPLQEGRKVAFHPPPNKANSATESDDNWILAVVTKCINADKNRYEVHDPEPQESGEPGLRYNTTLRSIIPLPDLNAPAGTPSSLAAYREFTAGSTVMALYPDTSCFYRAEVIATPREMQPQGRVKLIFTAPSYVPTYKVKFEDDDNQEHLVSAQWVVEWPGN
ncbi:hypothetical protein K435DRAFT_790409 [Dendrothele bispora CBS 962.96]|uniref:SGF29 C-terminal domain-containing protein n=1 Tax=Dendrothele bispora (strain CBS 962.96) TaxID=1314807 RepID=A0A4S8MQJ2_DENBC|nr:hypothetical protein K435DRAFT_790409 [Dendrothele bispora CBS 962.96]